MTDETQANDDATLEDALEAFNDPDVDRVRLDRDGVDVGEGKALATGRRRDDVDGLEPLLFASSDSSHLEKAVLFDAETDLYAVVSGHTRGEAMNQAEYDFKVHSIGTSLDVSVVDGTFDSRSDKKGWGAWLADEVINYGEDDGVYAVYPATDGFEIVLIEHDVDGLVGDRFTVSIEATGE